MNSYPIHDHDAEPELAPVIYEQPLNERMRTFLRLEFLYTQAHITPISHPWSTRSAVASLLEILAITARGDSRSEVLKELERHVNVLKEYQNQKPGRPEPFEVADVEPGEDAGGAIDAGGNFMGPLRDSEFLSAIKHRSAIPAAPAILTCGLLFWLTRPADVRSANQPPGCAHQAVVRQHRRTLWLTRQTRSANPRRRSAASTTAIRS